VRVYRRVGESHLDIVAAGVTFFTFLAIPPALVALVSLYGFVFDPVDVQRQVAELQQVVPGDVRDILVGQLNTLVGRTDAELGVGLFGGVLFALWSASKGLRALLQGVGITYREQRRHSIIKLYLLSLVTTAGAIVGGALMLALVVALPIVVDAVGLPEKTALLVELLRWPILALTLMLGLALIYRVGPRRRAARWPWLSWGAVVATLLWLAASALFSVFISNFTAYDETYGSLSSVIVTLLWIYVSVYVVLLGATLNAEAELQTTRDSTVGAPRRMGERGAWVADNLPEDADDVARDAVPSERRPVIGGDDLA